MSKRYYMFIPLNIDRDKNTRFVVETDGIPTGNLFTGRVVATNKKSYWWLGRKSDQWVNPIADLKSGNKPSFLPINVDEVKEQFNDHIL